MKIALYGHGKMGKVIERIAMERGHEVVLRVDGSNAGTAPTGADVAIEFSIPEQAVSNMERCLESGVPVVVGTTGWYDRLNHVEAKVAASKGTLLWASNFSFGVNLFFRVNRRLAELMDPQGTYDVLIDEVHHVHKLDAPSGTAITLARDIDMKTQRYHGWELEEGGTSKTPDNEAGDAVRPIPIRSERIGEIPGKHAVSWTGVHDRIVISHEAFDRNGFALGAVIAAEWVIGRKGMFTMDDLLDER